MNDPKDRRDTATPTATPTPTPTPVATAAATPTDALNLPTLAPGDDDHATRCAGYQLAAPHRPDLLVTPITPEDVRAAVRHARQRGLPLTVQSTGHGRSTATDGGVLIHTERMDTVHIDPDARTASVGAGATWGQVIEAAGPYGLAPLNGSAPSVGVVGYLLGGGIGLLGREFGYAADHVRRVDLVTGDGEQRRLTTDSTGEDAELFWALRGGGGGLGVVTGMEIDLVPVPRVWGGQLTFDGELAPQLLRTYLEWARDLPEQLTSSVQLIVYPDVPFLPEPMRGRYIAQVQIAWTGDAAEGERLVEPLRAVGPRLVDELGDMPYTESHTIHRDPEQPHAYDGDNALLSDLDADAMVELARQAGPEAPIMCVLGLKPLGGALARPPAAPGAVGHRDAAYLVSVLSPLDGTDTEAVRDLHGQQLATVAPWAVGHNHNLRFGIDHPHSAARPSHEPDTLPRLARLRATYGLFGPAGRSGPSSPELR